jgi:small subunit ribosomal protein S6
MPKYEAMFIIKPDLAEEEKKTLFSQLSDAVTKNNGTITSSAVWAEKRKLYFPLGKYREGTYYLMNFELPPQGVKEINQAYKLNENVLRVLITGVK